MTDAAFDEHAESFEDQCASGLALSGEDKHYFCHGRIAFLERWWRRQGLGPPKSVVDYGCGLGDGAEELARTFPLARVLGVDPSARCVARATAERGSDRVEFAELTDSTSATFPAADVVHVNGVLHHVPVGDRRRFVRLTARWLAPGGVLALFDNNPLNPGTRMVMARIPFDRDAVMIGAGATRALLREEGLVPLATGYLFYFPRFARLLRPLERCLERVPLGAQYAVIARRA